MKGIILSLATAAVVATGTAFIAGQHKSGQPVTETLAAPADSFLNPIAKGADPWVIKSGKYYYTCRGWANNTIVVTKSEKLTKLGPFKVVWKAPADSWNSKCIWAPELHHIGKKWYIYYAGGKSGPPFTWQRAGVLESVTDDPQGEYIDKGMLETGKDENDETGNIWAIDMTVTTINGNLYAIWSGWISNAKTDKTGQHMYIAKMSSPTKMGSERVKLSSAVEPWETGGPLNLNEGPEVIKHNGNTFIIYSTRESWLKSYRLGQLRLKDSTKNIMDPNNWVKSSGPVFQGTDQVLGPGHASFTTSPDGKEWWIFYHAKISEKPGWERDLRLQQFTWDAQGNPVFGTPIPAGTPMKKPGGEK